MGPIEIILVCVIVVTCLVSLLAAMMVAIDAYKDNKQKKADKNSVAKEVVQVVQPATTSNEMTLDNQITIVTNHETFRERLGKLENPIIEYCNEIETLLAKIAKVKKIENNRYVDYKIGNARIVRILVKRSTLICEFILMDSNFKDYIKTNRIDIKPKPVIIKVTDEQSLQVTMDSIQIALEAIRVEKMKRKEVATI